MMINRKENRFIAHCSLLIAHCLLLTNIVFAEELPQLDLQQLVDEALKNNPELISAKYRVEAFKEVPSQMGTLDDPKIEIGLIRVPMNTLSANEPMKEITVMQSLPYPKTLFKIRDGTKRGRGGRRRI